MTRTRKLIGGLLGAVFLACAPAVSIAADPVALRQQLLDAVTRGDVNAAVALYAEDAVIDGGGTCSLVPCIGKAAVRKDLENRIALQNRATTLDNHVSGNFLISHFQVTNKLTRKAGVERIIFWAVYEIRDNKIAAERLTYERTDTQTARYLELLTLEQSLQLPQ